MEMTDYCFSFFRKPIQNIEPMRAIGIVDAYRYIIGHYAQPQTENLRQMQSSPEAKRYKATHFDYCTFSGLFRKRNEKELIMHSGLMCLDLEEKKNKKSAVYFPGNSLCLFPAMAIYIQVFFRRPSL